MPHVKNQHIVPEFLLRNFSNIESYIWTFDKTAISKPWVNEKNRAIKSVPTENCFYDKRKGIADQSLEYTLSDIENKAAPIINTLISSKDLNQLSLNDRTIIAEFLSFQMLRTKGYLTFSENFLNQFCTPIEEVTGQKIERNGRIFWLNSLERAHEYKSYLLNKTWILAESSNSFYLSDNPLVLQNSTNNQQHRGNLGLESLGIEIYMPLSSSLLLCLFCNKTVLNPQSNIVCESNHVENLNWLQIVNSDRFIFSNQNNFDLIYRMIEEKKL